MVASWSYVTMHHSAKVLHTKRRSRLFLRRDRFAPLGFAFGHNSRFLPFLLQVYQVFASSSASACCCLRFCRCLTLAGFRIGVLSLKKYVIFRVNLASICWSAVASLQYYWLYELSLQSQLFWWSRPTTSIHSGVSSGWINGIKYTDISRIWTRLPYRLATKQFTFLLTGCWFFQEYPITVHYVAWQLYISISNTKHYSPNIPIGSVSSSYRANQIWVCFSQVLVSQFIVAIVGNGWPFCFFRGQARYSRPGSP